MSNTLEAAQREIAAYKTTAEEDRLLESLFEIEADLEALVKGGDGDGEGEPDADDDGEPDGDESDSADDDGDGEDEGEEAEEAPTKQPMGKSYTGAGADFAKSMVLTEDGQPSAVGEMIEVSDVLTHMTDTLAKSLGDQQAEIGAVQLQNDRGYELLKAIGQAVVALRKDVAGLKKSLSDGPLVKSQREEPRQPFGGAFYTGNRRVAATLDPETPQLLTKSVVSTALLDARTSGSITPEMYTAAARALDGSRGIEGALELITPAVAAAIRGDG